MGSGMTAQVLHIDHLCTGAVPPTVWIESEVGCLLMAASLDG
jgi:hypothetical protein